MDYRQLCARGRGRRVRGRSARSDRGGDPAAAAIDRQALLRALHHRDRPASGGASVATALVHDYLNQRGGAERVFAHIAAAWPQAPIYTSIFDRARLEDLFDATRVRTSFLQHVPMRRRLFRMLAPFYPLAFESFDLRRFDTVISSTTAWAKGIVVRPDAVHVCYCHTVSRFVFDYDRYVRELAGPLEPFARPVVRALARWDLQAAQRPSALVANSVNGAARIRAWYGREAHVLHPPVDIDRFEVGPGRGEYALIISRLLPYKRIDLAIEACRMAAVPLLVAGTGPAEERLRRLAKGTTTTMLGYVKDDALRVLLGDARVVLVPGTEDYGLVPVEAAACGRPTLAFGAGGALETVVPGVTGEFFHEETAESLAGALRSFEPGRYDPSRLRAHAEGFSPPRFIQRLQEIVEETREKHRP
ncbi:MAG: glycosyltransferase [bacterium]|nr:glycosyltransferase [bacterium]